MKKFLLVFGLIFLFVAQDIWALPTGRRTDVTALTAAEKATLAAAMLAYIDVDIISEHACNNEFGGSGAGSIHGPELFLNWHRNYITEMETAIAPTLASIPILNGLLPRWTHSFGLAAVTDFTVVDPDCSLACGGGSCAQPLGPGANAYPYPNPLLCTTWADFVTFSENLRTTYHNNGHVVLGGVMGNFRGPASPIFFLWHAMIDDVYWDFQNGCIGSGDLHIKDTPADTGVEPNPDTGPMWISQDIWVRQNQDTPTGGTTIPHGSTSYTNEGIHENPEYKITGDNYVYVRVRNTSADEFAGGRLRVYWSKASTGLNWPTTWINYFVGPVLHGDEITPPNAGASPVPAEANLLLPPIPPGGQFIMEIPWHVPNPADFTSDIHHFCLLARIVSPFDEMTFPEVASINTNVRNNNNIAWKNVSIYDLNPLNLVDPGNDNLTYISKEVKFMGVYATNPYGTEHDGVLDFGVVGDNFFDVGGVIYARMDFDLYLLWRAGGYGGAGVERLGKLGEREYVRITKSSATMKNLVFPANSNFALEMGFALSEQIDPGKKFEYDVTQYLSDRRIGGERYELRVIDPTLNRGAKPELVTTQVNITPNPARDQFTLSFNMENAGEATIALYDISGRQVSEVMERMYPAGYQNQLVDVAHLTKGIYILRIQIGQQVINKKVVIE